MLDLDISPYESFRESLYSVPSAKGFHYVNDTLGVFCLFEVCLIQVIS